MPVFVEANPPEILRAAQKDDSFIDSIRSEVAEIIQRVFGNQTWMKIQALSDIGCIFLYYSLTTLADSQTLGEEYVGLLQVDSTLRSLPTRPVRLLAISLQVLGPRIFTKLLTKLEIWFRDPEHFPDLQPKAREYIVALIDVAKSGSFWFGRLNLILFYIFGKYYRLSQRMTKIHYVFTLDYADSGNYNSTFRLIGKVGLVHLTLLVISNLVSKWKDSKAIQGPTNSSQVSDGRNAQTESTAKCSLCWDQRKNTACTPCGHLFCWLCILQWLQTKEECPLCRENVQPSRIVPLFNYK